MDGMSSIAHPPAGTHVIDFRPDQNATSELAVDRQIKQSKIALWLETPTPSPISVTAGLSSVEQ